MIWTDPVFLSAVGSAVGGFFGVVTFFGVRLALEFWRTRPREVRTYHCVSTINRGQESEHKGELQHHSGKLLEDPQKFGVSHAVWEWAREKAGDKKGNSVFYGPYCMDLAEPGLYEVVFRVRGFGLVSPTEISEDRSLLKLDILRTQQRSSLVPQGPAPGQYAVLNYPSQDTIAMTYVRVSAIANGKWSDIRLRFYSDGKGEWEFRCFAFDGFGERPDNLSLYGNARIFFDSITVLKISEVRLPWA